MSINPRNVVELLCQEYEGYQPTETSKEDIEMKDMIKDILDSRIAALSEAEFDIPIEVSLPGTSGENNPCTSGFTDQTRKTRQNKNGIELSENGDISDFDDESIDSEDSRSVVPLSYKRKAVLYWKKNYQNAEKGRGKIKRKKNQRDKQLRSFSSVKAIFPKVKNLNELYRWENTVKKRGTIKDKINQLNKVVYEKFKAKRDLAGEGGNVHDVDIRKFGFEAARGIDFPQFKASKRWLEHFKKEYKIGSRKVTKHLSRKQVQDRDMIQKSADDFVKVVKELMERIGTSNTYNSDQSGFQLEMHTGRTLNEKGAKHVTSIVQSVHATTHSYTIQPVVNADGVLSTPMLLVLKEPKGVFGPLVKKTLFHAPNLKVVASASGKCTTTILKDWYQTVFKPKIKNESILLLDAFGGFNKATSEEAEEDEGGEDCENGGGEQEIAGDDDGSSIVHIQRIPKNTTGLCQPLDLIGFRAWKVFIRRISDSSEVVEFEFSLRVRNNLIKLQSLIFNQMCSPRYYDMFKFGWYTGNYLVVHPPPYQTPVEYSFNPSVLKTCEEEGCTRAAFLRCGWCTHQLCFTDFVINYHLCENFIE